MGNPVPRRIATTIMNALKGGVVPRVGLEYIAVGRKLEIEALLHDTEVISDGGAAFRFVVGRFGSGKSFLLQTIRNNAMERGFVLADCDLAPDRRLTGTGGQGINTYRELMKNLSVRARPDGGALPLVLEKWISGIQSQVAQQGGDPEGEDVEKAVYRGCEGLSGMVNGFDFAQVILRYLKGYLTGDETQKTNALRWFRGEYASRLEAKRDLGVHFIVTDDNWYDFMKLMAEFFAAAGYQGLILLIDEMINLYKLPNVITRQYNYERVLTMYNDALQGKARHIGVIMSGTPQSVEDPKRGLFSYEALRSRLVGGKYSVPGMKDLLAPIIRLEPLTAEEMYVLLERLRDIHAGLYGYDTQVTGDEMLHFLSVEYGRLGADASLTPREVIRDFVELLDVAYQSHKPIPEIMKSAEFEFSVGELEDGDDGFADFTV